jgi:hypothetical protein
MSAERATWRIAGIAVLGLAVAALVIGSNPANLPESWLERWILRKLPLGSSIVAVRNAIDEEGWKTVDEGVSDTGSLVIVEIGRARVPRKYAYVYFAFDRYGRLVSVEVRKTVQVVGAPAALR